MYIPTSIRDVQKIKDLDVLAVKLDELKKNQQLMTDEKKLYPELNAVIRYAERKLNRMRRQKAELMGA